MIIRARAPLRLGLAGGGTDVSPYCDKYGGYVLNATIDRYAYAVIRLLDDPYLIFKAMDQNKVKVKKIDEPLELNGKFNLHKAVYNEIIRKYNGGNPIALELSTFCDAPPGSGLGASSTIVVAMLQAFVELLSLPLDDYAIAQLAYRIERIECGLQGGRQDQFSATFGGFNFMEFYDGDRAIINPLRIKDWVICELEASLILFYTGVSRESSRIISDQSINVQHNRYDTVEAMHGMKQEALVMKECLLKGDIEGMVKSMKLGWENKKRSARTVSTPLIEEIYDAAIAAGANAGKVSGAGGGGFMMFFVSPSKRMDVIRALSHFNGQISNCHFTKKGAQSWKTNELNYLNTN